ncbi:CYTH domain-containing protein [Guyparkeria hydrothermalis]|uniref:CYTH domain-containing protein n=1 Tax=Guyparkeria halophila TaxID=47960 RepID=A0A6I6D488_9GAMM|nr:MULTISPECIES: CYTH domain-containing protein [Guyparkeria]MCL7750932.1 CYTH domain-containing protein [Guyparkeria hydrothermalis]QGT79077.1 CYTH domain-containing protein [Guyparkeria halophila]TKA90602.1 CYTH domain-containing protein [Guyparkeria sp. SB14A]
MAKEIERKFLLTDEAWRNQIERSERMVQGYLNDQGPVSVRARIAGDRAWLNIKSRTLGISRDEFEYEIPLADAERMLDHLTTGPVIDKTRHFVTYGEHLWEIDEFHGENDGLIVAEVELDHVDQPFARPAWLGEEVSHDARYYNVSLVKNPYSQW